MKRKENKQKGGVKESEWRVGAEEWRKGEKERPQEGRGKEMRCLHIVKGLFVWMVDGTLATWINQN